MAGSGNRRGLWVFLFLVFGLPALFSAMILPFNPPLALPWVVVTWTVAAVSGYRIWRIDHPPEPAERNIDMPGKPAEPGWNAIDSWLPDVLVLAVYGLVIFVGLPVAIYVGITSGDWTWLVVWAALAVVATVLLGAWAWFSLTATAKQGDQEAQAHRDATIRRLADQERLGDERAEELFSGWEAEAATRGLENYASAFWDEGERWMADQIRATDKPQIGGPG